LTSRAGWWNIETARPRRHYQERMAFNFFKKNKDDAPASAGGSSGGSKPPAGGAAEPGGESEGFKRDERKAEKWFHHAQAVADHDFAIECYIHGLEHDPDNMRAHEAAHEVARKRKSAGGKSAGLGEKLGGGKGPVHKFLHAEKIWLKDPDNLGLMITAMQRAVEADEAEQDLRLGEFAYWIGSLILQPRAKPATLSQLIEVRELFARVNAFDKAVEACKMILALDPGNGQHLQRLKDLEAEKTMQLGNYGGGKQGDFRDNIKDADKQRELEQDDAIAKTDQVIDQTITRRRAELEESPDDVDRVSKLVDALILKESDSTDDEAMRVLGDTWGKSGQYRFKQRLGDVKIRQFNRQLRVLKPIAEASPPHSEDRKAFQELAGKKLSFELTEFGERAQNYPTDMSVRYELGRRLFASKRFDEAIAAFQQAKSDPKWRAASNEYLGQCYVHQGWLDEAIDTFRQGLDAGPDEKRRLEMQYFLMDALERAAAKSRDAEQAREALKVGSQVMQANISFKDIRPRMEKIRKLVEELSKPPATPA
jgi:tetratricopeptide (TPR) repeat protein